MEFSNGYVSTFQKFFLRIPAADWSHLYLYIPSDFVRKYKFQIPKNVSFRVCNGDIFEVNFNKECGCFVGLSKLFDRYSLQSSDFLFFEFCGGSEFKLCIANSTTVEIDYPTPAMYYYLSLVDAGEIPIQKPLVPLIGLGKELSDDMNASLILTTRRASGFHQFKILIRPSCLVAPEAVVIPLDCEWLFDHVRDASPIFVHFLERGWEIMVQRCPAHLLMTTGWSKFVQEADLKVGDLCVFQRRITSSGYVVGVYKSFESTVLKLKGADKKPKMFIKFVDDAAIEDGKIHVPELFSEIYLHHIPPACVILTGGNQTFSVQFDIEQSVFVGLEQMMVHEKISQGKLILFKYLSMGVFHASVFSSNGCDIFMD